MFPLRFEQMPYKHLAALKGSESFFCCCFAQQALSLTVILFRKTDVQVGSCGCDFMNPDEGYLKIYKDLVLSVFIGPQRQSSLPLKFLFMQ